MSDKKDRTYTHDQLKSSQKSLIVLIVIVVICTALASWAVFYDYLEKDLEQAITNQETRQIGIFYIESNDGVSTISIKGE